MVVTQSPTLSSQRFYPTRIDLPEEVRLQVVAILSKTLATSVDLKTQVKQAHWNVRGMDFYQLHTLFDELAGEIENYIDMVAERITALGSVANGTVRVAAMESLLSEYPLDAVEGRAHVDALAERYAIYANHVRDAITSSEGVGDDNTADLYTEISRSADMRLWFLEAHLFQ